jgi:hypothetical protein
MARKTGPDHSSRTRHLVRPASMSVAMRKPAKRKYIGKQIRGGLRDAQAHLRSLACEVHAIEAAGEVKALPNPRKTERKRPQPAKLRQL